MIHRPVLVLALVTLLGVSAAAAQEVETCEDYPDTTGLISRWLYATGLDTTTNHTPGGTKSLRLEGFHEPLTGRYSLNEFEAPVDLSGLQVGIWVRRDPSSVSTTSVTIDLADGFGGLCSLVDVPITGTDWRRLIRDMDSCIGFDETLVVSMKLQILNLTKAAGTLAANFDDLGVYVFVGGFETGDTSRWSATEPST